MCYRCMLTAYEATQRWSSAIELLRTMQRGRERGDAASYAFALRSCDKKRNGDACLDILKSMEASRTLPNQECYRAAIRACAGSNLWQQGLSLWEEMQSRGLELDEETLVYVFRACNLSQDLEQTSSVLRKIEASDNAQLSEVHYDMVISSCERAGNWQQIVAVAARMGARGVSPHEITCNSVLKACVELDQIEVALNLLNTMESNDTSLDSVAYSTVLKACAEVKRWEEIIRIYEELAERAPTLLCRDIVAPAIAALAEVDRLDDAAALYGKSVASGWLQLWRRARFGGGPALLDTRSLPPQVAGVALRAAIEDVGREVGRTTDQRGHELTALAGLSAAGPQDLLVLVDHSANTSRRGRRAPKAGSTAATVLKVARELLGKDVNLDSVKDPFPCIRIPGPQLQALRVKAV